MTIWLAISASVILADQATKLLVLGTLELSEHVTVTPFFDLVLVFNPGAAFSFLADASGWQRWFFVALAGVVSVWLLVLMRKHAHERWLPLGLALVLGGALGNLIDRLLHGAVVDFLYFHIHEHYWPAFNVADSAISVGVALMLIDQFVAHGRADHASD